MIEILKCRNCGYIGPWKECCEHMSFDEPTANEAWAAALAATRSAPSLPAWDGLTDDQVEEFVGPLIKEHLSGYARHYVTYNDGQRNDRVTSDMRNLTRAILAAPRQPGEMGAGVQPVVPSFDCSLAATDSHDPQSFIDGAKWAQDRLAAASAQQDEREAGLLPCPLCGHRAELRQNEVFHDRTDMVTCVSCGCGAHVSKWNNRAAQQVQADAGAVRPAAESDKRDALDPVHGDVLPAIGTRVQINLASTNSWHECTVVGYYVWPSREGNPRLHRVNIRVRMDDGTENARMLCDIRAAMSREQGEDK